MNYGKTLKIQSLIMKFQGSVSLPTFLQLKLDETLNFIHDQSEVEGNVLTGISELLTLVEMLKSDGRVSAILIERIEKLRTDLRSIMTCPEEKVSLAGFPFRKIIVRKNA